MAERDAMGLWLEQAGRVPLLTHREELELGRLIQRWQQWDGGPAAAPADVRRRGLRARDRMVSANLRLVVAVARKYRGAAEQAGLEVVDLLQEGAIGLQRGAERFDPTRGFKASTYLHWWIMQAVGRAVDSGGVIRLPSGTASKLRRLAAGEQEPEDPLMRVRLQAAAASRHVRSVDARLKTGDSDSSTLADQLTADAPDQLEDLHWQHLLEHLRSLLPDEVALLELRLLDDYSAAEIGELLAMSPERVRKRLNMARERLQLVA